RPVGEEGFPPAVPSNPNSRLGRSRSPLAQGWDQMDAIFVGIDVSKDRLDVAVQPTGESFSVSRTGAGIEELGERLKAMSPKVVAVEATGGFETVVAAGRSRGDLSLGGGKSAAGGGLCHSAGERRQS